MRAIDAYELKRSLAVSALIEDQKTLEQIIDEQPTIEERKKGKWIRHSIGHENTPWGYDCSACNTWLVISEDTAERYNFCPNCGARMKI